jgi:hypothetical protein
MMMHGGRDSVLEEPQQPEGEVIMNVASERVGCDEGRDPYFHAADVGPAKSTGTGPPDPERRRRQFQTRTSILVVALAAVWIGVLLDPRLGPLVLMVLAVFGMTLGVVGAAMGLGLLGFGLFAAGDRVIGWLRNASRWPDE